MIFVGLVPVGAGAAGSGLGFRQVSLELPGSPAEVISADLNGDGRRDLVVVVNVSEWTQKEVQDTSELDQIKGLVDTMTIIPAVDDRREVRVFLARPDGGYRALAPMVLPLSVLGMEAGPPGAPVLALTDEGVSALRLGAGDQLRLEPLIADPPVLAGTRAFVSKLELVHDLDGDGIPDLVLPARDGLAIYLGTAAGLASTPVARLAVPGEALTSVGELLHSYPLPLVAAVSGSGRPDLVFRDPQRGWAKLWVVRNAGGGRFLPPVEIAFGDGAGGAAAPGGTGGGKARQPHPERPVFFGDVEGGGVAELVTAQSLDADPKGLRSGLKEANEPLNRYRFYRIDRELHLAAQPHRTLDAKGHAFGQLAGGLQDLNGDRRLDFLTVTLDLSVWKAMKLVVTRSLALTVDFHVWCQDGSSTFRAVNGLDLTGRLRFNLNDLKLNQLASFAGDFNGDGRADFIQLGRGKEVTVHLGRQDCSFPTAPDFRFQLRDEPRDIALVQVRDLDGDGRADLMVIEPRSPADPALALSGDGEERADALIAGEAGALYALDPPWGSAPAGRWRRVLAGQGLDLRSVRGGDGREGGRPRARLPRLPVGHAGGFELLAAGAADRGPIELHPTASFPLPLVAARTPWGLELGSHPVQLLPGPWPSLAPDRPGADGGPAVPSGAAAQFAVGPEGQGQQRLRTLLLPAAAGEAPVEAWSLRPAPGYDDESRYELWEGQPVLVLSSVPKLGIFVKREVQVFLLSKDRSRGGSPPVLSAVTGCHMWQRLTTHFVALDGGGRQDFVLIHPDGLRGRKLHFEVWSGLRGNRLDPRSTASTVDVEPEEWFYGADFSGDRIPDLMVRSGGRLLLYPGVAGKRRLAERPAWSFQLPEPPPRRTNPREKDEDGGGGPEANAPGSATPPEGRLGALVDLRGDGQGDGQAALVLTVADAQGRTQVVTVRRIQ